MTEKELLTKSLLEIMASRGLKITAKDAATVFESTTEQTKRLIWTYAKNIPLIPFLYDT